MTATLAIYLLVGLCVSLYVVTELWERAQAQQRWVRLAVLTVLSVFTWPVLAVGSLVWSSDCGRRWLTELVPPSSGGPRG